MAYRSHQTRLAPKTLAALCVAGCLPFVVSGCQNTAQYDLVARELRMQEDQLYAMEDYLNQYQQLICKYRSENAALRRELAEQGDEPMPLPAAPDRAPPPADSPDIEMPDAPERPPLEAPDVPPIGETTHQIDDVLLRGEVVENESGGGPRLVVDVEPHSEAGVAASYDGALSLMLIEPGEDGEPQKIGRWDYAPEDVQAAIDPDAPRRIRFFIELPPETPVPDSTELWVQLLPRDGGRLVTHAPIDLHQPGTFASINSGTPAVTEPLEQPVMAAVYHEEQTAIYQEEQLDVPAVESEILDGGWTISRPNEPAGMTAETDSATSEWRPSSEPPPQPIAVSTRVASPLEPEAPPRVTERVDAAPTSPTTATWSPDRPAKASTRRTAATRPAWSAHR